MEHILHLGIGDGVFHLHEINVGGQTQKLFATTSITSSDQFEHDNEIEKQSYIAHQSALMRRYLKGFYELYSRPDFETVTLSAQAKETFRKILNEITSGHFPNIRLTKEGIRVLGAINSKLDPRDDERIPKIIDFPANRSKRDRLRSPSFHNGAIEQ